MRRSTPAIDPPLSARIERWRTVARRKTIGPISFRRCDLSEDYELLAGLLQRFRPDALVHFVEQPSAPFSMACRDHAEHRHRRGLARSRPMAKARLSVPSVRRDPRCSTPSVRGLFTTFQK
jgi:hypothetical protein